MLKMLLKLICALCVLNLTTGQETQENACDNLNLKGVENLNINNTMGIWYGIQENNNRNKCVTINATNNGTNITVDYNCNITMHNYFNFTYNSTDQQHKILAVNYTSYVVIWTCEKQNEKYEQNLWIYSRDRNISSNHLIEIKELLTANKLENITLKNIIQDEKECTPNTISSSNLLVGSFGLIMLAIISIF